MARQLPPFSGLRAFEAAARHLSFKRAAEELNLTQSAISHQIKGLEAYLGTALFYRTSHVLRITEDGAHYFPVVQEALERLGVATTRLRSKDRSVTLTVSVLASFANRWLIPRLPSFNAAHPQVEVELAVVGNNVDFARSDIDASIRYARDLSQEGLRIDPLMPEEVFPVCSPELLRGPPPLEEPVDLAGHVLVHNISAPNEWRIWLDGLKLTGIDFERGPKFQTSDLVLHAVSSGVGVGLGRKPIVNDDLAAGRLVAPFDLPMITGVRYFLTCPLDAADQPKIAAFRNWLFSQLEPE